LKDAVRTHGGKDWAAIAALVPGRTKKQCHNRWNDALDPSIALTGGSKGKWREEEENSKLVGAVQTHGGKNWVAIAALVPGRTGKQCNKRWHDALVASIDGATVRKGKFTADEESKLKDAVQTHSGKSWAAVAALVQGRTANQCRKRWNALARQQDAVQTHSDKDWAAIAALVPGGTGKQSQVRVELVVV
jgi:hypothetical protein